MTKLQITAGAVLLAAGLTTAVLQHQTAEKLRAENLALQAQGAELSRLQNENARLSNSLAQADQSGLSRDQMSELLRLRSQAGQLRSELKAAQAAAQTRTVRPGVPETTAPATNDLTTPFTAEFTARVPTDQTLLTGGWSTSPGMRTFMLVTPVAVNATGSRITGATASGETPQTQITSMVFEVPDRLLAQLGLDQFTSDSRQSSLQNVLGTDDSKSLVDAVKNTDGVNVLSQPRAVTSDGNGATVSITGPVPPNGEGPTPSKTFTFIPHFAADGSGIDLAVKASITPPTPK